MELGFVILAIVMIVIGVVIGIIIERFRKKPEGTQGVIYAYCGEPGSKPSLLLEYSVPIDDITSRKRVVFDVTAIR